MRKHLFTVLLTLLSINTFAQKFKEPEIRTATLGSINNKTISGTRIIFDYAVYACDIDSATHSVIAALRVDNPRIATNNQFLVSIDIATKKINWKKYVHGGNGLLLFTDNHIINACEGQTRCYSKKDCSMVWKTDSEIYFTNKQQTIGYSNKGEGIDLETGKTLWEKRLQYESGIQEVVNIDDNRTIVSADGIHMLNMNNGKSWYYPAHTTITDFDPLYTSIAASIALGAFTGMYFIAGTDALTNDCSDIQRDDAGNIYYACKSSIISLKPDGTVNWKSNFQDKIAEHSTIYLTNDHVVFINNAYSYRGYQAVTMTDPYFCLYKRNTGELVYRQPIGSRKYILSSNLSGNLLTLVAADSIYQYNVSNGELASQINVKKEGLQGFTQITDVNTHYVPKGGGYITLAEAYPGDLFFYNRENGRFIHTTSSLKQVDIWQPGDIWKRYRQIGQTDFIANYTTTLLYKNGVRTGVLNTNGIAGCVNNTLVDRGRYDITIADLGNLNL